ncbi:MAG: NYN domain-containing protein [bacterium]|nr:NYN domain-containing protein [bacterium]
MHQNIQHKDQRVGIFIDIQNLYHSAKNLYGARVNYNELIKALLAGRNLIRATGYVVKSEGVEGATPPSPAPVRRDSVGDDPHGGARIASSEAAFFEALEKEGIELRMKDLQVYAGGMKKADWDVGMAVDAIRMGSALDVVILVTGDGDFIPLVEYLKWGLGRQVEVAAFGRSASGKLKEIADRFTNLEAIPRLIMRTRASRLGARPHTKDFGVGARRLNS